MKNKCKTALNYFLKVGTKYANQINAYSGSICADCALSLTDSISFCLLYTDSDEAIVQCVKGLITSADICYPCICDVLPLFDIQCPAVAA